MIYRHFFPHRRRRLQIQARRQQREEEERKRKESEEEEASEGKEKGDVKSGGNRKNLKPKQRGSRRKATVGKKGEESDKGAHSEIEKEEGEDSDGNKGGGEMSFEEAAVVIEGAFLEFLEEEEEGEAKKDDRENRKENEEKETDKGPPDSVPKRVFTDFSEKMAEGILGEAKEELKDKDKQEEDKDDLRTIEEGEEEEEEAADEEDGFDEAVDALVGSILAREARNRTNGETTAPGEDDFNKRPKFNFADLPQKQKQLQNGGGGDPVVIFSARRGIRPPPLSATAAAAAAGRSRRPSTHSERLRRLRQGRRSSSTATATAVAVSQSSSLSSSSRAS